MRTVLWLILPVAMVVTLARCTSIQCGANTAQFIEQYDAFIEEVVGTGMRVTDPKWPIYDDRFETYITECYPELKEQLTQGNRQHVISQGMRYYYARYGSHMITELNDPSTASSEVIRNELREIWKADTLFREMAEEDWDVMMTDFLEDLERWKSIITEITEDTGQ